MSHPTTERQVQRTSAIASLVVDVMRGWAITGEEARTRLGSIVVNRYMPGIWEATPTASVEIDTAGLTPSEAAIMRVLAARCGRYVSSTELAPALRYANAFEVHRTVQQHICNIRAKGWPIRTWSGRGYALDGRALRVPRVVHMREFRRREA
jgi:DNA-binding response OmpR family regulator